tara:strand:- start:2160 stop:2702 length:543 start_codon:yes stop_codon:yes gene_type:complete
MENYLDILTYDNIEYILELITYNIEITINLVNNKINKLNNKLKPLQIKYYDEYDIYNNYTNIKYDYVNYCICKYLFKSIEKYSYIILINKYDDFFGSIEGKTFISKKMYNPTYLDILIEANKSVIITGDYHRTFLEGLKKIKNNEIKNYIGINPEKNINYYEFVYYYEFILCDSVSNNHD